MKFILRLIFTFTFSQVNNLLTTGLVGFGSFTAGRLLNLFGLCSELPEAIEVLPLRTDHHWPRVFGL